MRTARQICYEALLSVYRDKGYSNLVLDGLLGEVSPKGDSISAVDKAFATNLFYGVLQHKITLDYIISKYVDSKKKLDIRNSVILQMGIYQMIYMNSVPDSACVDESVKLVRNDNGKGFVNAILRNFLRDDKKFELPDINNDKALYYSVVYSCPKWLVSMIIAQYGEEDAIQFLANSVEKADIVARVNTLKTTSDKLIGYLENKGVTATKHYYLKDSLILTNTGSIKNSVQFKQGLFHIQDTASQLSAMALAPKKGDVVLDICSAPGSKSFTLAQLMENDGEIYSFDLHEHKIKLIKDGAKRLGIKIITPSLQDGLVFNEDIKQADCILCDVPCSGLGIIRRKPEIKYKDSSFLDELPKLQYDILTNASKYLKSGGRLIYSTCTLNKKENEKVINKFLKENDSFKTLNLSNFFDTLDCGDLNIDNEMITLLPNKNKTDGFFIAGIEKL